MTSDEERPLPRESDVLVPGAPRDEPGAWVPGQVERWVLRPCCPWCGHGRIRVERVVRHVQYCRCPGCGRKHKRRR